jgi:nitroreductase
MGGEMNVYEAIAKRKTVRAFKPDPVPRHLLEKILKAAIRAPSSSNAQPWDFVVVQGEKKEELSEILVRYSRDKKKFSTDEPNKQPFKSIPSTYTDRMARHRENMGAEMEKYGVVVSDVEMMEGSYRFYGAPVAVMLLIDKGLNTRYLLDVGAASMALHLACQEEGLATCSIGMLLNYELDVKEFLQIPPNKRLIVSIGIGYPDYDNPVTRPETYREDLSRVSSWIGFE